MAESTDFRARQIEFAAYIRDPDNQPAPANIEARRMGVYADLFFNNVRNFLGGHFPVLRELLGEDRWALLVRDYYRDHQSHSPLFPDMPREFLSYLADERASGKRTDEQPDPPFMYELAHYEWVEAGLLMAEEEPPAGEIDPEGDLLDNHAGAIQRRLVAELRMACARDRQGASTAGACGESSALPCVQGCGREGAVSAPQCRQRTSVRAADRKQQPQRTDRTGTDRRGT